MRNVASAFCIFFICTCLLIASVDTTTNEGQCDEDSDEPCFFDDIDDEDTSTPVLLRKDESYPLYDQLSRIEDVRVFFFSLLSF